MKLKLFSLLLLLMFPLSFNLSATPLPTLEQINASIQTQINSIETFEAKVITQIQSPIINEGKPYIQISKIYKKGEDKVRTELVTPDVQILVENGNWLYTQNPQTGQVIKTERKNKKESFDGLGQLQKIDEYLKDYAFKIKSTPQNKILLIGSPKTPNQLVERVEIIFKGDDYQVEQIQVFNKQNVVVFK